jgi:hypothetical protein
MDKYMLRVPGSANQTIYISALQMEKQKILYTNRHWDIKLICRALIGTILTACAPSSPTEVWEIYNSHMAEDIFRQIYKANSNMDMDLTVDIYNFRFGCIRNKPQQRVAGYS